MCFLQVFVTPPPFLSYCEAHCVTSLYEMRRTNKVWFDLIWFVLSSTFELQSWQVGINSGGIRFCNAKHFFNFKANNLKCNCANRPKHLATRSDEKRTVCFPFTQPCTNTGVWFFHCKLGRVAIRCIAVYSTRTASSNPEQDSRRGHRANI